ncbi:AAA family ATPase [Pseudomonas putida]|nr:AAA family ATPase [Pseudomonas putida]
MSGTTPFQTPRWMRDLVRFLPLKSQFVLSGNIRDLQACEVVPGTVTAQSFNQTLCNALLDTGYGHVLAWDPVVGFRVLGKPGSDPAPGQALLQELGLTPVNGAASAGIDLLAATMQRLLAHTDTPVALIIDFASRLAVRSDSLNAAEHQLFTQALVHAHQARSRPQPQTRKPFFNTLLWLVEKEGDLPDWLLVDNPRIRHIPVSKPDQLTRRALAPALLKGLAGSQEASQDALAQAAEAFVQNTEGLLLLDLSAIAQLARVEGVPMVQIADAVRRYKVGVTEDPWLRIDRQRIRKGEELVHQRVKGQDHAVTHMLDIVKRAMTGVGASRKGNRPRGVAFLAGPTGVGKTELAKTMTSLLFGDESAYIRFDMSEFSAEHADQRLIGAPPWLFTYPEIFFTLPRLSHQTAPLPASSRIRERG